MATDCTALLAPLNEDAPVERAEALTARVAALHDGGETLRSPCFEAVLNRLLRGERQLAELQWSAEGGQAADDGWARLLRQAQRVAHQLAIRRLCDELVGRGARPAYVRSVLRRFKLPPTSIDTRTGGRDHARAADVTRA